MQIETANRKELRPFLTELFDAQHRQHFGEEVLAESEQELALCAKKDGQLLGGIIAKYQYQTLHISMLVVDYHARQGGVGSALLQAMEELAFDKGIQTITLTTKDFQAVDFYLKNGYQQFAQLEDVPMLGVTKHYFVKRRK
ncbi:GNAT family N-acetyltransferase [Enterococcus sp. AZ109]|uniref:GNAT family N-acetyltransferase n=1 Tax=Enterococcus sp. AZ109 TaxID=2774634 RepID=UPI003F227ABD